MVVYISEMILDYFCICRLQFLVRSLLGTGDSVTDSRGNREKITLGRRPVVTTKDQLSYHGRFANELQ